MDVDTFREGMDVMEDLIGSRSKEQDIYMYCTGGIRCSVAGSYLRNKGYQRVKMLKGGVTAYGHYVQLQNKPSLFRGKNFTFDGRRGERVTDDVLSFCHQCGAPCDSMTNCINTRCHLLFILCEQCRAKTRTCSQMCQDTVDGKVQWTAEYDYHRQIRPPPLKQAV
ncbi:uncharacterized protein BYT42DRAFT_542518 [Radiomyces spectabilis]|uniref:uncharacterized protein n=1 Tax=Radiomyces spectabilis TaxID=64574 RepID=UPI00221FA308|nr:uncharacterized protein BYT42DRAFT_542518 [Radiomyces spectabilis]KAI8390871.1 hypothetical protein BYT42DRAFT_542518 [Radiomyces spectabilis]